MRLLMLPVGRIVVILTHLTTCSNSSAVLCRAPHRNSMSTGPYIIGHCPGHTAIPVQLKDVPNAVLILLWQSSAQGLPWPQGPRTQRKYTYLTNPPRCLALCSISPLVYCPVST